MEQRYRKKPVVVTATQWFGDGDHANVYPYAGRPSLIECPICCKEWAHHGEVHATGCSHIVCPGNYIVTDERGNRTLVSPDIFEATYERID